MTFLILHFVLSVTRRHNFTYWEGKIKSSRKPLNIVKANFTRMLLGTLIEQLFLAHLCPLVHVRPCHHFMSVKFSHTTGPIWQMILSSYWQPHTSEIRWTIAVTWSNYIFNFNFSSISWKTRDQWRSYHWRNVHKQINKKYWYIL